MGNFLCCANSQGGEKEVDVGANPPGKQQTQEAHTLTYHPRKHACSPPHRQKCEDTQTYMWTRAHTRVHIQTHRRAHTCPYTHNTRTHVSIYKHTDAHTHVHTHTTRAHTCPYTHTHTHTNKDAHTHAYTHTEAAELTQHLNQTSCPACAWLRELGLERYAPAFINAGYDDWWVSFRDSL